MGAAASETRARAHAWLAKWSPWITAFADFCVYGSFIVFYVLMFASANYEQFAKWLPHYASGGLAVNYKRVPNPRMYAYYVLNDILTCSPLMGGAILVTVTRRLPKGPPQRALRWFKVSARRVLQCQLPPRRFFSWWCGGMTVLDATLVSLYVAANLYWCLWPLADTRRSSVLPLKRVGLFTKNPPFYLYLDTFARYAGLALYWSLWLLFLPLPHSSFLQTLTGIDYAGMIRYHRWLGHGTMVMTTLHTIPYYALWTYEGEFLYQFRDWSSHEYINNLAGSIAWFGGLLLWFTSFDWVRRNHFELFYGVHLFGFVVYVVFACLHWFGGYNMFVPGALLWMVDLVFRQASYGNVTTVAGATVNATENTADITLLHSKRSSCPIGHVYFLIPKISRFQWHPFTVRAQDQDGGLHLSVKATGPFTRDLLSRLARRERVDMRVVAPPHRMAHEWENHDSVVIAAGGVGITGAWAVLSAMAHERAERRAAGRSVEDLPKSVHIVWTARSADEFFTLERWVADALEDPDRWLRLTLHCTGKGKGGAISFKSPGDELDDELAQRESSDELARRESSDERRSASPAAETLDAQRDSGSKRPTDGSLEQANKLRTEAGGSSDAGGSSGAEFPAPLPSPRARREADVALPGSGDGVPAFAAWNASPVFTNALRRIQPGGSGDIVWVLTHFLVFFGSFMSVLCTAAYDSETYYYLSNNPNATDKQYHREYYMAGFVLMFGFIVGGIGFPYLTLIFPMHVARYVKDLYWNNKAELISPYCLPAEVSCTVTDSVVRISDTDVVLPINAGRPDLDAAVAEAEGPIVGVYASGPEAMNHDLRVAASAAGKLFGKTYYDYRKLTTML